MLARDYGATGVKVSAIGFGAMQIGAPDISEAAAAAMLHGVLDRGVTLIDTARSYGLSEERIGRHLAARRHEFILSTKVGYDVEGYADWTHGCVVAGVDAARRRLRTDMIDIVHLHSCGVDTLRHGGVLEALAECRTRGWLRFAAYSGDGAALDFAAQSGLVDGVQASVNFCDQHALRIAADTPASGLGFLAKRVFLGHPWRQPHEPSDPSHAEYWRRFRQLQAELGERDWAGYALRFAVHAPGVTACLLGGTRLDNLSDNLRVAALGPLAADGQELLRAVFARRADSWTGVI